MQTSEDTMIPIDRKEYFFSPYCTLAKTVSFLKLFASIDKKGKRELNELLILKRNQRRN